MQEQLKIALIQSDLVWENPEQNQNNFSKKIKNAEVVAEKKTDEVQIGSKVVLKRTSDKEEQEYFIVGVTEANILAHKISNESPVGAAIIGKKVKTKVLEDKSKQEVQVELINLNETYSFNTKTNLLYKGEELINLSKKETLLIQALITNIKEIKTVINAKM